ncbi:hypothetical protein EC843_102162 [Buttiauxella sp. JUb87]|jgi:hypothetical protein|uniref:hypothetical protein n=1 Tax=Buttiauxella sp. JUb87 TaxID=2485129 RepID=UPI00105E57A0|nr:hypothetical protein [Buttiauxella sp. JUb87]TDN52730.1 hypothetical protein EC843_102162 [Buttiauxella sp. JUb87]
MNNKTQSAYLFPQNVSYSIEYQKENFWRCVYSSTSSKALHYKVVLPLYVKPVLTKPTEIEGLGITMIGLYQTTKVQAKPYLEVTIAYETIENEINGSDWLYHILDLMGEVIIDKRVFFAESGEYTDVLTQKMYDSENMISRFRVIKDSGMEAEGANFFLIKATCHKENYVVLNEDILQSIAWFTLINENEWKMAESLKSINADNPEKFSFYYPVSWSVKQAEDSILGLSHYTLAHIIGHKKKNMINLFFMVPGKEVTAQFISDTMFKRLEDIFHIGSPTLKNVMNKRNVKLDQLWTAQIEINNEDKKIRNLLTLYVGCTESLWFYFELISPHPDQSFYDWAVNKRALEIILNSLNNFDSEFNNIG